MAYEKPTVKRLGSFAEFTKQLKQVGSADGIILITNEEDIPLTNYSG